MEQDSVLKSYWLHGLTVPIAATSNWVLSHSPLGRAKGHRLSTAWHDLEARVPKGPREARPHLTRMSLDLALSTSDVFSFAVFIFADLWAYRNSWLCRACVCPTLLQSSVHVWLRTLALGTGGASEFAAGLNGWIETKNEALHQRNSEGSTGSTESTVKQFALQFALLLRKPLIQASSRRTIRWTGQRNTATNNEIWWDGEQCEDIWMKC